MNNKVTLKNDGFFHGEKVHYDNVLDWDLWQRNIWKEKVLSAEDGELIISEEGQKVKRVSGEEEVVLTEDGILNFYKDRFEIIVPGGETITMKIADMTQVSLTGKDVVLLVDKDNFLDINSKTPRSATKYIAAWRYLTGKEYY